MPKNRIPATMPFIFDNLYPEITSTGMASRTLRILLDLNDCTRDTVEDIRALATLKSYFESLKGQSLGLQLLTSSVAPSVSFSTYGIEAIEITGDYGWSKEKYAEIALKYDLDIVASPRFALPKIPSPPGAETCLIGNYADAKRHAEFFARGHDAPWSFSEIVWNSPWGGFYQECDEFGKTAASLLVQYSTMNLDDDTSEILRSLLLNRSCHLCYSRDKLNFYLLQRRRAKRQNWERQGFVQEFGYYLTNFYMTMWGGTDQLALILNKALNIKLPARTAVGFGKGKFVSALRKRSPLIAGIWDDDESKRWYTHLQDVRHYVSHRGTAELRKVVDSNSVIPPDEEIWAEIARTDVYKRMELYLDKESFFEYKQREFALRRASKYKTLWEDMTFVQGGDGKPSYFTNSAMSINWNFDNYSKSLLNTLQSLLGQLHSERQKGV